MQYHCQRLWFSGLLECFSEDPFLGCVCRCFILVFFFLQLTLRFIWTDFFPMGGDMDLVSVLHMWLFSFPSTICWRSDIFIFYFWYVCQKSDDLHGFISRSDIYPLISMLVFVPVLCCFCYYSSVIFEIKYCNTISIAYFAQNCFGYLDFFFFLKMNVCVCVTHLEIRGQFWQWILIFFLVESRWDKVSYFCCCCLF